MNPQRIKADIHSSSSMLDDDLCSVAGLGSLATCLAACNVKHPFNKDKRQECKAACMEKFNVPPPEEGAPEPVPPPKPPGRQAYLNPKWTFKLPEKFKPQPASGSSGILFAGLMWDQLPIYLSIPIVAICVYQFNKQRIKNFFTKSIST